MNRLIIRLFINATALWIAATYIDGIHLDGDVVSVLIVAAIFGIINALIKPIIDLFTCPFYLITLGLFTLIVNALMLMLTGTLSSGRLRVDDFWSAFLGGVVISLVSTLLSLFLSKDEHS